MILLKFRLKCRLDSQCSEMLLVTVILAFILAANSLDCVWLKNAQGAGKLTSLMESKIGPAQYHLNQKNIELYLFDSQKTSTRNMTLVVMFDGHSLQLSKWMSHNNVDLSVLFASDQNVKTKNETKFLTFNLQANVTFKSDVILLVHTIQGSFIFNFQLSLDQVRQNPSLALKIIEYNTSEPPFSLKNDQILIFDLVLSLAVLTSNLYFFKYPAKLRNHFQQRKTVDALFLLSQLLFYVTIYPKMEEYSHGYYILMVLFTMFKFTLILIYKVLKYSTSWDEDKFQEILEDVFIIILILSARYELYLLALIYCIIRDTQASTGARQYPLVQRWTSHCYSILVILYIPTLKIFYNTPNEFPFDSAIFWWGYFFMLVYLMSIREMDFRGGVKNCCRKGKEVVLRKMEDYCRILHKREIENGRMQRISLEQQQQSLEAAGEINQHGQKKSSAHYQQSIQERKVNELK